MLKTLLILAIIIVILVGALFFFGGMGASAPDEMQNTAAIATVTTPEPFTGSGDFMIATTTSTLNWEGKKPLLPNDYTDKGLVGIKSGGVKTEKGLIQAGTIVIDLSTISVASTGLGKGEEMLAKALKGADFFDVAKYPTAELAIATSTAADAADPLSQTVSGTLAIKGIKNPISFPVRITREGSGFTASARVELDRTLWNLRYGSGKFFKNLGDNLIADTFAVSFEISAAPVSTSTISASMTAPSVAH